MNKGTVRDLVGNANTQSAVLTVKYRPKSAGLEVRRAAPRRRRATLSCARRPLLHGVYIRSVGPAQPASARPPRPAPPQGASIAANVFLGSSLALCTAASYLSSAFLPYAPGVLGCGAISLVGYAQVGALLHPPDPSPPSLPCCPPARWPFRLARLRNHPPKSGMLCGCQLTHATAGQRMPSWHAWAGGRPSLMPHHPPAPQSIYLTGHVSAQWLPENYRQVANSFGWTVGEIRWVDGGGAGCGRGRPPSALKWSLVLPRAR